MKSQGRSEKATVTTPAESIIDNGIGAEAGLEGTPIRDDIEEAIPNGGLLAWMQVLGSFMLFFNCWGTINAFGVFQTYYESSENIYWTESASNISWIGSIQAFLLLVVGSPMFDRGYFRTLVISGTFFIVFGFCMTSLAHSYWSVLLAQGFLGGIGCGMLFVPSVAILPTYFTTRKSLANGLAASGSSVGGIVYPITFRALQQRVGFGWATRAIAFIALATLTFSIAIMRQRKVPTTKRKLTWDLNAFKEMPYLLYCLAMFLAFSSFYVFIYFVQPYAIDTGIVDASFGFYLLPILNAASVPGRILPNAIGDYIGPMNVLIPASFFTGVLALVWIAIKSRASIIAVACLYGFFSGAFVSICPIALVVLTPHLNMLGERMGMSFAFSSIGLLFGTPVAGAILAKTGGWLGPQLFSGILLIATALMFLASRVSHSGWKFLVKA